MSQVSGMPVTARGGPKATSASEHTSKRAPRKLPTPGGQKTTGAVKKTATAALEAKVAELTMSLEVVQKGTDTILERAVAAEAQVTELLTQVDKKSNSNTDALQLKVEHSVALKAVEERGRKRLEEKDTMFAQMKEVKESEISMLKATIESQQGQVQSKTASLQGQMAALQGELMDVKSFTAEQNKFVSNLGEENQKLVGEIKRLKEQAKVRDQQLQESVYLARDAIVREKKKREEWLTKMNAGGQVQGNM